MSQFELFSMPHPGRISVSEALDIDWDLHGQHTRGGRHAISKYNHVRRLLGERLCYSLNEYDVKLYRIIRTKEGAGPATINREHVIITAMFNRLRKWRKMRRVGTYNTEAWELPDVNPGSEVSKVDERPFSRKRVLKRREFQHFLSHCTPRLRDICIMAILTTFRFRDLYTLRQSHINQETNRLEIVQSKTGKPCAATITPAIQKIIDRAQGASLLDFKNFTKEFRAARSSSKIRFQFRDLRRTGARRLLACGEDIMTVRDILGHTNVRTTEIYTFCAGPDITRAGKTLEKEFS